MMKQVFADTSFYQALFSRRDRRHESAVEILESLRAEIVTTECILLELATLMSRGNARVVFVRFLDRLRSDPATVLIRTSPEMFDEGLALFAGRPDKEWSLRDCISFVVMRDNHITEALTSDHHFEQAGFHALLNG